MPWYGAQVIMYVKFKDGDQAKTPVWANTCLIQATDYSGAIESARKVGLDEEGDAEGSMTWDDRPAEWAFGGVRAVSELYHRGPTDEPGSGDEVLFEEYIVDGLAGVEALVKGRSLKVEVTELRKPDSEGPNL